MKETSYFITKYNINNIFVILQEEHGYNKGIERTSTRLNGPPLPDPIFATVLATVPGMCMETELVILEKSII